MIHPYYAPNFYERIDAKVIAVYLGSGLLITVADYGSFTLLYLYGLGLLVATAIAYVIGLIVSYVLNRYLVFRKTASRQSNSTNLRRYIIFLIINLVITYLMLYTMENRLGISPFLGKFVVGFFMIFWVYAGSKYWVFKGPKLGPIKL